MEGAFLIRVVLGLQWAELCRSSNCALAGIVQPAIATTGLVQLSLGKSRRYLSWGVVSTLAIVASIVVGLRFGAVGVAGVVRDGKLPPAVPTVRFCLTQQPGPRGGVLSGVGRGCPGQCGSWCRSARVRSSDLRRDRSGCTWPQSAPSWSSTACHAFAQRTVRETLRLVHRGVFLNTRDMRMPIRRDTA